MNGTEAVKSVSEKRYVNFVAAVSKAADYRAVRRINDFSFFLAVDGNAYQRAAVSCGFYFKCISACFKMIGNIAAVESKPLIYYRVKRNSFGQRGYGFASACLANTEISENIAPFGVG